MTRTPYYPAGLQLDGYHEQLLGKASILGTFFSIAALQVALTWLLTGKLRTRDRVLVTWLVFTGIVHIVVEGAFVLNDKFYQNADPKMLLLELWKEYSKADSRYATRDAFTTTMETTTAFAVGPAALLAAAGVMLRASWRWVLILVLSTFQLYGDILYFATYWFEGMVHTRPEPLYFWAYFVVMNSIWVVIPVWCVAVCVAECSTATRALESGKKRR